MYGETTQEHAHRALFEVRLRLMALAQKYLLGHLDNVAIDLFRGWYRNTSQTVLGKDIAFVYRIACDGIAAEFMAAVQSHVIIITAEKSSI